jgi:RNA polymerase primary sigma factor
MKITKHRLLTANEEKMLAQQIEKGSTAARNTLITHNLRLALSVANKYRRSGLNMEDISQEANVGLIRAVDKFDWRKGFRFSTYAVWWIKQAVRRFISSQSSHVKFPAGSRHLIYQINRLRGEYEKEFGVFPEDKEIASMLGVTPDSVSSLRVGMQWPVNIDHPVGGEHGSRTYAEVIPDMSFSIDDMIDQQDILLLIKKGFAVLTPQEERVIRLRFGIAENDDNLEKYPTSKGEK